MNDGSMRPARTLLRKVFEFPANNDNNTDNIGDTGAVGTGR